MKIESMRPRSYRSFKVDDADLPAKVRERPARPGAEVRAPAPRPALVVQAERREGRPGSAPQAPVHGQVADPAHARTRLSVSAIGRILSRAIAAGAVPLASIREGRVKPKRRRRFDDWPHRT